MFYGNTNVISISKKLVQHSRTKHFGIRYYFIKDIVESNIIALEHIHTEGQLAIYTLRLWILLDLKYCEKQCAYVACPKTYSMYISFIIFILCVHFVCMCFVFI